MTAHVESRILVRQADRILERLPVGHQRGRPQNPVLMRLHDALVHIPREPEVIRIDNESLQISHMLFTAETQRR